MYQEKESMEREKIKIQKGVRIMYRPTPGERRGCVI